MRIRHQHSPSPSRNYFRGERSTAKGRFRSYYAIPSRKGKESLKNTLKTPSKKFQSRVVTFVSSKRKMGKENHRYSNNHVKQRYSNCEKPSFDIVSKRPKLPLTYCPNAPHNTTSFLMSFHRDEILNKFEIDRSWGSDDEDDVDLSEFPPCHSYGSFFGSIGDSYEVLSQISAPQ